MRDTRIRSITKLAVTVAVAVLSWLFLWPAVLGGSMTYVVVSGPSMEPTYHTGDLVVAREASDYEIGDVVVFDTGDGNVIHRVTGGDGQSGYVTQGDNNPDPDRWTPTEDEVLGEAVLHLPGVGDAVMLARQVLITPPFPYLLAGFVFLVIVLGDDKNSDRRGRRSRGSEPMDLDPDSAPAAAPGALEDIAQ
jgi:signal peptidase